MIRFRRRGRCVRSCHRRFCRKGFWCFFGEDSFQWSWSLTEICLQILVESIESSEGDFIEITNCLNKAGDFCHRRFTLLFGIRLGDHGESAAAMTQFIARVDKAALEFSGGILC